MFKTYYILQNHKIYIYIYTHYARQACVHLSVVHFTAVFLTRNNNTTNRFSIRVGTHECIK